LLELNHFNDILKTPPPHRKKSKSVRDGIFNGFKNMGYLRLFDQLPVVIDSGKSVANKNYVRDFEDNRKSFKMCK
jgi:hypothetical protein